ncbi:hypothetical protein, partial [Fodinicola feengrottensis]|uniref:hypothetical protein n=1 Tax=Fodinicola feengrottensis TaxID=435914 RepID=UPI002441EA45
DPRNASRVGQFSGQLALSCCSGALRFLCGALSCSRSSFPFSGQEFSLFLLAGAGREPVSALNVTENRSPPSMPVMG